MKCWITLTSHSGTVNAERPRLSNEGWLLRSGIERVPAMSFRAVQCAAISFDFIRWLEIIDAEALLSLCFDIVIKL
jgi:hypothetical protein